MMPNVSCAMRNLIKSSKKERLLLRGRALISENSVDVLASRVGLGVGCVVGGWTTC